jgi:hypothetical protein
MQAKQPLLHPPLHLHELVDPLLRSLEPPLAGADSRGGRPSLAAGELLAGAVPPLSNTPNRTLVARRTSPSPSPAKSGGELAGIAPEPRRQRPQGLHCETQNLSRVPAAKGELQ